MWGIQPSRVVYNFPKFKGLNTQEFVFKLDYSPDKASWPRAYALAASDDKPAVRCILPVFLTKQYNDFAIQMSGWYDMPMELHEQIIKIVGETKIKRTLPLWQRAWNRITTSRYQYSNAVAIEDYTFVVCRHNNELILRAA